MPIARVTVDVGTVALQTIQVQAHTRPHYPRDASGGGTAPKADFRGPPWDNHMDGGWPVRANIDGLAGYRQVPFSIHDPTTYIRST